MNNNNNSYDERYVKKLISEDGEITEKEVLVKGRTSHRFKEKYFCMFQGEYMNKQIRLNSIKQVFGGKTHLLFYLMNQIDSQNEVRKTRKEICQDLDINEQMLSKQLKQLKDIEMVSIENHRIKFNPYFISKGPVKNHPNSF